MKAIGLAVLLGMAMAVSARAAEPQEYLLRLEREDRLGRVLTGNGLTLVRTISWLRLHVVTGPANVPPATLEAKVRAYRDVMTFEREQTAVMGNVDGHPDLRETTEALHDALEIDRTPVAYYGAEAWQGFVNQPALIQIDVPTSRATGNIGTGVIVAIIDTGVDPRHELLQGALVHAGYDFTRNLPSATDWADLEQSTAAILDHHDCPWVPAGTVEQSTAAILDQSTAAILDGQDISTVPGDGGSTLDPACVPAQVNQSTAAILDGDTIQALEGVMVPAAFGHGTMVAGLVRAVAPGARILPVKAFRADGTGRAADIAQAIYYSVMSGAKVINMSFSFTAPSQEVLWATAWAAQQGAVLVASAGNRGRVMQVWPAEHKWVISVGSTTSSDARSLFSNHGYDVFRVGAPGEKLLTLYPGGRYASVSGTSFSTALVSGAVALMATTVPFLEWGASADVMRLAPFAEVFDVERDLSGDYPGRLVAPAAVKLTPSVDRDSVKRLNNVR